MNQRHYGTSGYHPSNHFKKEKEEPKAKKPRRKNLLKKLATWALIIVAILLLYLWLVLGNFRFMLAKYPAFTGFPFGSRNYLVLFQNNYELRPTGGFISTYGELKFSNGIYKGIEFFDVYGSIDDHDYVEPPLVLSALLDDENYTGHSFRDANFDPDFTMAKADIIEFYQLTNPDKRVDGIIAADFTFLENLVSLYQPLSVEGYELTEENLFEILSAEVSDIDRHSEEALANRKKISGPIVKKIIKKSMFLPWRAKKVLNEAATAFDEKHLLASFERNRLEKAFAKRNWNGTLPKSTSGDFLAVNDANYGGMKSNRYILRDVTYELNVTEQRDVLGNPIINAKVTVELSHEGIWNIPLSGLYTGFLRVMIPLGSDIKQGSSISEKREDVYVLGELTEVQPGEKVSFTYEYELPEYVWENGTYLLHLHKQPGTQADHYRVIVRLPQGIGMTSDQFEVRENIGFFESNLATDLNLSFTLLEDENPPRIISHEITAMNQITLLFNERVSPEHAENPLNYEITDMNYEFPDLTDQIFIENIRADGAAVIITTTGMTQQAEERYEVMLRDLSDTKNNFIEPNPRTVTVVQRNIETPEVIEEEPLTETEEIDG